MKITNNRLSKKKFVIRVAIVLFVVLCGYLGYALKAHIWPFTQTKQTATSSDQTSSGSQSIAKKDLDSNTGTATTNQPDTPTQTEAQSQPVATITQLDQSDTDVIFAASITNQSVAGSCVVTFSNPNDKPVVEQPDVTIKNMTAVCGPVNVSKLKFTYIGDWSVVVHYYSSTGQDITTNSTINIR